MKKLSLTITLVLAGALLVLAGCSKNDDAARQGAQQGDQQAAPATQPAASGTAGETWHGNVLETMDAASYTYALLDVGGEQVWVAGPQTTVAVGDHVHVGAGMAMPDFESKALGRTFDVIYFVGAIEQGDHGGQPAATPQDHPGGAMPQDHPGGTMPSGMGAGNDPTSHTTTARETVEGVAKADGGQTVAEIFIDAASLKDKTVKVRGRVVKFSPNIMGTNWIHLQDGTGAEGTHDLTVTSATAVKVGDVVLVEGPLSVDRDFGAGYRYPVIVENATVTVE
ncbi:MAG: nucleotide-binding protein [Candidatus Krumholzibacteriia bacterium]